MILSLLFFYNYSRKNESEQPVEANVVGEYTIGVYKEKVAVFTQGDVLPIEIYDVYISTLPILDQKELSKGIKVKGIAELKQRIEDYTS